MMRGHEHIADLGPRRDEVGQGFAFDVAGQQEPAAGGLDSQHEARLVVVGPGVDRMLVRRGMHHPHAAERVDRECLSRPHDLHRHVIRGSPAAHLRHARRRTGEERLRDDDPAHAKPREQIGHGVEVIGVGMRDHKRVDPRDSLRPQE